MRKWLVTFLCFICASAFPCGWTGYSFLDEVKHISYGETMCVHVTYSPDWGKNNYTMLFYYKGSPTGTIIYEYTDKNLDFILNMLNTYTSKNLSFYGIISAEFGSEAKTNNSKLTHQIMSIEPRDLNGNFTIYIKDKKW